MKFRNVPTFHMGDNESMAYVGSRNPEVIVFEFDCTSVSISDAIRLRNWLGQAIPDEMTELEKARTDYEILTSDYEELAYDVLELREQVSKMQAALTAIAKLGTLTLIGGRDLDPERAYQHGANSAFGQAAEMARAALTLPSGEAKL